MSLLEIKDLTKTFVKGKQKFTAVDHLNLTVELGECVGLVGESGCGKSTTSAMVMHLLQQDSGEIWFDGEKLNNKTIKSARHKLQMIFQNPVDSFDPRYTLLNGVKQGLRFFENPGKEILEEKAKEAIRFVGLKESYYNRRIAELSGGECQRAAIARAIISEPKLIICDEATSALDVSVQAQVVALLKRLKEEKQISYLFITHDLMLAYTMCDRIAVMYRGEIVELGTSAQIIRSPLHPYTQMLLSCVLPPKVDPNFELKDNSILREATEDGCNFYPYCIKACDRCKFAHPQQKMVRDRQVACFCCE